MSTRKKEKKDKKSSQSEEATGGASASVIPDSEQKTHRKGSVSSAGASGGGKGEKKGFFSKKKKGSKVVPGDIPSVRTLSVSSEPPAYSPKRPEDEPESCNDSVSDVEEKRVMAECQERIGALEEEVKKLNSEKEEARKSMDERETEMQRVNNENNELKASIKEKEVEMEEKVREGEAKWKTVIGEKEAAISEKEEVMKKIVEEQDKKVAESQTQLNLVKQQTELTLQAKTIELQGKDVTIRSLETDIKDQKRSLAEVNDSLAKEKQTNLKLKDNLRQSEEQARFQQGDLEKQLADLNEEHRRTLQDQDEKQQQKAELLTQQMREDHKKELAEMTRRARDLEGEMRKVKGEHEEACQELQRLTKELAMTKEKREDENRLADEQDKDWKLKLEDLQNKYQQTEIELGQEKVKGQEKVCDLEDKLMEKEETVEMLRVGLEKEKQLHMEKKGSFVPQDTARQVTYSMQKQGADTSPGHSAQHTKLTDPEGKFKGHDVRFEAMATSGEDKSPHSSLPEEKSPFSSLNEVKVVVNEDNMTDADKLELQEMLKQSQEELEKLWNHNKILVERVRVLEEAQSDVKTETLDSETLDLEKSETLDMKKSETLEKTGNISPEPGAFQRLKTKYLSTVEEKMQLLEKLEERDNQLKVLREEKLAKGEESTANYPDVMRSLSVGDAQSPADPRAEVDRLRGVLEDREKKIHNLQVQLNSFQQVASGNVTLEEQIIQLKGKLEASEREIKRLKDESELVQVYTLLHKEHDSVRERMKILEQEKQAIEDEKGIWKSEISAEKENKESLQAQIVRLTAALSFYEARYPQDDSADSSEMKPSDQRELSRKLHKADVAEFRNTISRKESAIKNMQTQRCTLERRMARLEEERDRLAEQNLTLMAVKANLKQELSRYDEGNIEWLRVQATQLQKQMLVKVTEVEGLTKEKEMMIQEIKDLQHEIEAWRVEAALTKEDFEKERTERENMALRLDNLENENLKDREQDYKDEIHHLKSSLNHLTHESGQRELQLTAKLEHSIKHAREMEQSFVKLQGECSDARDERNLAKNEMQRVLQANEDQKIKHSKELEKAMSSRSEEMNTLEGQLLSLQDHAKQLDMEKRKNEKQAAQTKREFENQLHEVRQRSGSEIEHLKSKLGALDQQRKHEMADWQRDRNRLDEAIADTAKLSDELLSLNQQLKHFRTQAEGYKAKFQEEKSKVQLTQEMLMRKEQEHKDEVDLMKAQLESEKMEQLVAARRQHNVPNTTQFPDVYNRMQPQVNPPPTHVKTDYEVRPYKDQSHPSSATPRLHHLGDHDGRTELQAYTQQPRDVNVQPRNTNPTDDPSSYGNVHHVNAHHGNTHHGNQQQKMLNKGYLEKPYGAKSSILPGAKGLEQNYQNPNQLPTTRRGGSQNVGTVDSPAYNQRQALSDSQITPGQHYKRSPPPNQHPPHSPQPHHAVPPPRGPYPSGHVPSATTFPQTEGKQPSALQENLLLKDLDVDISQAAAAVREEVTVDSLHSVQEAWPLDSNLICPVCKKQFRIGQIQHYKQHVDKCQCV